MNITRRDTIIIATIFNLLVFVAVIASGKMGGASKQAPITQLAPQALSSAPVMHTAVAINGISSSPLAQNAQGSDGVDSAFRSHDEANTAEANNLASLRPNEELYSYDEIDQLLEEYALQQNVPSMEEALKVSPASKTKPLSKAETPQQAAQTANQKTASKNKLSAPGSQANVKASRDQKKSLSLSNSSVYIVQPGDNPWTIAKKCKMSFEKLLELNNLDEAKAKNLKIGQVLKIHPKSDEEQ